MIKQGVCRLLRQSIIDLCKNSVGAEGYVEIDGIVCITVVGEASEEIVVKVHKVLGEGEEAYNSYKPTRSPNALPRNTPAAPDRPGHGQRMPSNHGKAEQKSRNESFKCGICYKTTYTKQSLIDHLISEYEFLGCHTCLLCHEYFPNLPSFVVHRKLSHPNVKEVMCKNCGVGLMHTEYNNHRKECTEDRKKTQQGGKKTPTLDNAKGQRMDPPQTPSSCRSKKLPPIQTSSNKTQDKNKPQHSSARFKCGLCSKTSDVRQSIVEHLRSVHKFQCCYSCMLCHEYFPDRQSFLYHRKLSHPNVKEVICQNCCVGLKQTEYSNHRKECVEEGRRTQHQGSKKPPIPDNKAKGATPAKRQRIDPPLSQPFKNMPSPTSSTKTYDKQLQHTSTSNDPTCGKEVKRDGSEKPHSQTSSNKPHDKQPQHPSTSYHPISSKEPKRDGSEKPHSQTSSNKPHNKQPQHPSTSYHPISSKEPKRDGSDKPHSQTSSNKTHEKQPQHPSTTHRPISSSKEVKSDGSEKPHGQTSSNKPPDKQPQHPSTTHRPISSSKEVKSDGSEKPHSQTSSNKTHEKQPQHPSTSHHPTSSSKDVKRDGSESFKCGVCVKISDSRQAMVDHLKSRHDYLSCYTCMLCHKYFPNKHRFVYHRKHNHPNAKDVICQTGCVGLKQTEYSNHRMECIEEARKTQKRGKKSPTPDNAKGATPAKRQRIDPPLSPSSKSMPRPTSSNKTPDKQSQHPSISPHPTCGNEEKIDGSEKPHSQTPSTKIHDKPPQQTSASPRSMSVEEVKKDERESFECGFCGSTSDSRESTVEHLRSAHNFLGSHLILCMLCHKYFPDPPSFATHHKICQLKAPVPLFKEEGKAEIHHVIVCEACQLPFISLPELEAHIKTHQTNGGHRADSGEIPPVSKQNTPTCSIASATSTTPSENTTVASFKCGVCGSVSEQQDTMIEHLKATHTFLGCFTCLLCQKFFPSRPTYIMHRKLFHKNAKELTCEKCSVGLMKCEFDAHVTECSITVEDMDVKPCIEESESKVCMEAETDGHHGVTSTTPSENINTAAGSESSNTAAGSESTTVASFKCGVCGSVSERQDTIVAHLKATHEYDGCYACLLCAAFFPSESTYYMHHTLYHSDAAPVVVELKPESVPLAEGSARQIDLQGAECEVKKDIKQEPESDAPVAESLGSGIIIQIAQWEEEEIQQVK